MSARRSSRGPNFAELPTRIRGLRACLHCRLVKSTQQFQDSGCENCNDIYQDDDVQNYTTPVFKGLIAMMDPGTSWIARWHGQTRKVRGLYAMKVYGAAKEAEAAQDEDNEM